MIRLALVFALLPSFALAADLTPEDYQAALVEANSIISGMTTRAEQLAVQIAQQNREIAKLRAAEAKPVEPAKP